jgi:hypothetical protein
MEIASRTGGVRAVFWHRDRGVVPSTTALSASQGRKSSCRSELNAASAVWWGTAGLVEWRLRYFFTAIGTNAKQALATLERHPTVSVSQPFEKRVLA